MQCLKENEKMNNKYDVFIQLLNFNREKYTAEKVFKDFISLLAISLSNKVYFNQENSNMYQRIYENYKKEEQFNFYALSTELNRLFCSQKDPYDILGDVYHKLTNKNYLKLLNNNPFQEIERKQQGVININNKISNGKMIEMNCGSGTMILAYASILKLFKLDYKIDLEVTAIDTDIINVFMTYIQLYFYGISAIVILLDKTKNKELMRLYTSSYENEEENLMVA